MSALPKWFEPKGPFSAVIDLTDLGFGKVTVQDPNGAGFAECMDAAKKYGATSVRSLAAHLKVYIKGIDGGNGLPAPGSPDQAWLEFVGQQPSTISRRIVEGCNLIGGELDSGN